MSKFHRIGEIPSFERTPMKHLSFLVLLGLLNMPTWAQVSFEPLLNKVSLHLHAEQWVTTKSALVTVTVNAALTDNGIEKIQSQVIQKLSQIASGDWHVVSFDRNQDKSGLENVTMVAQARLAQTDLGSLRDKAKNLSKPGETYTLSSVQFTPSDAESQQANIALRNDIYQQAKNEIDSLNKSYPDQKFYLHRIDFNSSPVPLIEPMANSYMPKMAMSASSAPPTPPLAVGNKQVMDANVELAAMPGVLSQKLTNAT